MSRNYKVDVDDDNDSVGSSKAVVSSFSAAYHIYHLETFVGKFRFTIVKILDNFHYILILSILTIWTLFSDDIRLAATVKGADIGFEVIISIIFFIYIIEIIATTYSKPGYFKLPDFKYIPNEIWSDSWKRHIQFGSFYLWLDVLATLSLLFEMPWVFQTADSAFINAASNAARMARMIRIFRLLRLVRLVRLFKYSSMYTFARSRSMTRQESEDGEVLESHVGARMSDLTNQRVIILVLSILLVIPALTIVQVDESLDMATALINRMAVLNTTNSTYLPGLNKAINYVKEKTKVIEIDFQYTTYTNIYYYDTRVESLRNIEKRIVSINNKHSDLKATTLYFDQSYDAKQYALYNIYTTLIVMFLLFSATYFFSSDVKRLVIVPIERMVQLVRQISKNPLGVQFKMLGAEHGFHEGLETTVLLSTITKIGSLMRVGFGEAGASVIAKNLEESSGGKLNLMGTGTLINSIFGFCDVRNFTDITECLQEEVMLFVNRIAHILHGIVVQCSGSANKNIGDAFLLTWKIDDKIANTNDASLIADQALLAFLKTMVSLIRYEDFICNFTPQATTRLYKRFPGYGVRIGCGLHYGWAIEGAIGSNRKIDASYLSPNVNFTEYLESSTKQYNVSVLMSEPFFKMLSPNVSKLCRQVDRIRRHEGDIPMALYTYDCDLNINYADYTRTRAHTKYDTRPTHSFKATNSKLLKAARETTIGVSVMRGLFRNTSLEKRNDIFSARPNIGSENLKAAPEIKLSTYNPAIWYKDDDLLELRHRVENKEFKVKWPQGIGYYTSGNWKEAKECFEYCLELTNNFDGPSKFLLKYMSKYNYEAPEDWPGYRDEESGH